MISDYGKKTYQALGKMLVRVRPDVADELMIQLSHPDNERDFDRVPVYLKNFCAGQNYFIGDLYGKLDTYKKMRKRRVFIACILQLYCREVFHHPPDYPIIPVGLVTAISTTVHMKKPYTSQLIRNILHDMRHYDDFSTEVFQALEQLKNKPNGHAKEKQHQ